MAAKSEAVVGPLSLKERLTLRRLDSLVHHLRLTFEEDLSCLTPLVHACASCPAFNRTASPEEQEQLARLIHETSEILHSSEFLGVIKSCSDALFAALLEHFAHHFQQEYERNLATASAINGGASNPVTPLAVSSPHNNNHYHLYDIELPLAKLVPVVNGVAGHILTPPASPATADTEIRFVDTLLESHVLRSFTQNVFNTFSSQPTVSRD